MANFGQAYEEGRKMAEQKERVLVDTRATARYNTRHGPLAQLAEQLTLNQQVTGSIPVRLTLKLKSRLVAQNECF